MLGLTSMCIVVRAGGVRVESHMTVCFGGSCTHTPGFMIPQNRIITRSSEYVSLDNLWQPFTIRFLLTYKLTLKKTFKVYMLCQHLLKNYLNQKLHQLILFNGPALT